MSDSMELKSIENNNKNDEKGQVTLAAGNGGCTTQPDAAPSENDPLITEIPETGPAGNGGCTTQPDAAPSENDLVIIDILTREDVAAGNNSSAPDPEHEVRQSTKAKSAVERVKKELNKTVVWKVRLWMIPIIILLAIILVTFVSIALKIALYRDPDDKYDVSSFVVPRVFRGSLSVVNQSFSRNSTAALHDLATQVQDKLNKLYNSSHALGRYFSDARVKTLREGSVIIEFCLKFHMPLDSDLLQRYTLSQEMVSSVLRQHLYDQDASDGARDPLYIEPTNATIQDGGSGCTN